MKCSRFELFNGWEVALRTFLDMRGLAFYLVNTELDDAHVVQVQIIESLIQMMTPALGLAYPELLC